MGRIQGHRYRLRCVSPRISRTRNTVTGPVTSTSKGSSPPATSPRPHRTTIAGECIRPRNFFHITEWYRNVLLPRRRSDREVSHRTGGIGTVVITRITAPAVVVSYSAESNASTSPRTLSSVGKMRQVSRMVIIITKHQVTVTAGKIPARTEYRPRGSPPSSSPCRENNPVQIQQQPNAVAVRVENGKIARNLLQTEQKRPDREEYT